MTLTAGVISLISASSNTATLSATAASDGTPPYTQQWYRDTSGTGFTPGAGNILTGQTELSLTDNNLVPNTQYFYKLVYTDAVPDTAISTAFVVTTLPVSQGMNQFAMTAILGAIDLISGSKNVVSALIDATQLTPLYAGQRIKFFNSPYALPTIVAAGTSMPSGYIIYDPKSQNFPAGSRCEIARTLECMWLYSTSPIVRGAQVSIDPNVAYGVQALSGSNLPIVGEAYDQSIGAGQLIRIILNVPSFAYDNDSSALAIAPTQQVFTNGDSGTYTPTVREKSVLYIHLQGYAGGGGGEGSGTGAPTGGEGGDGTDTTFVGPGGTFAAHGGKGATFSDAGAGGGFDITTSCAGYGMYGKNGSVNSGIIYGSAFGVSPNNLSNFLQGGSGGDSMFPGGGQGYGDSNSLDAVQYTGGGGGGGYIATDSTVNTVWNSGHGGGGGGWFDYIIPIMPGDQYEYSCGSGGDYGTAGNLGISGGNGANGSLIITEYYQ